MTELQFDILDELYFVTGFEDLQKQTGLEKARLLNELGKMIDNGWVKIFEGETELEKEQLDPDPAISTTYRFLATKKGLFAHNSK